MLEKKRNKTISYCFVCHYLSHTLMMENTMNKISLCMQLTTSHKGILTNSSVEPRGLKTGNSQGHLNIHIL